MNSVKKHPLVQKLVPPVMQAVIIASLFGLLKLGYDISQIGELALSEARLTRQELTALQNQQEARRVQAVAENAARTQREAELRGDVRDLSSALAELGRIMERQMQAVRDLTGRIDRLDQRMQRQEDRERQPELGGSELLRMLAFLPVLSKW